MMLLWIDSSGKVKPTRRFGLDLLSVDRPSKLEHRFRRRISSLCSFPPQKVPFLLVLERVRRRFPKRLYQHHESLGQTLVWYFAP